MGAPKEPGTPPFLLGLAWRCLEARLTFALSIGAPKQPGTPPFLLGLAWRCLEAHLTFLGKRIHLVLEILYKKAWIYSSKAVQAHLSWTHHPSPAVIVLTPYCNPQVNIKY
jgi:hypothetical protein